MAVETADVVLMRSDPLDVATAITISRGTKRKMHQNLAWAVGYNSLALPVAAGVFEPLGFVVNRVFVVFQNFPQKKFEQTMAANDFQSDFAPFFG